MFAVIRSGGKQYKVTEGETLDIELVDFPAEGEKKITLSDVLLVGTGDKFSVGNPLLSGATVGLDSGTGASSAPAHGIAVSVTPAKMPARTSG